MTATMLEIAFVAAAAAQLAVAVLNLGLVRTLGWQPTLASLPALMRQVFVVHLWFISLTLVLFAGVSFAFAAELAQPTQALTRAVAAGIALFWGVRAALQVFYYDTAHWRGRAGRTAVHVAMIGLCASLAMLYGYAAAAG